MKIPQILILNFILLLVFSCSEEPTEIGSGFFQDGSLAIVKTDTLTLEVSTVMIDSLITGYGSRLIAGYHQDENLGKLSATSYFQIVPDNLTVLDANTTRYSRTTLALTYDGYSFYDTLSYSILNVHELSEEMQTSSGYFYNTTSFKYKPEPLGTLKFQARPKSEELLEIPLEDAFGKNLFQLSASSALEVSTSSSFLKYFKGLAIVPPDSISGPLLGFTTTPELRIYYYDHSKVPVDDEQYISFSINDYIHFNHTSADRSETRLSTLKNSRNQLKSEQTEGKAYVQSGTGLGLRVEVPYLKDILLQNENIIVSDAILQIMPISGTHVKNVPLPSVLSVSVINEQNVSLGALQDQAVLVEDVYLGRDTYYGLNVRDFIQSQMLTQETNKNALLFSFVDESLNASLSRIYLGDQKSPYQMKLKIYFLIVNH